MGFHNNMYKKENEVFVTSLYEIDRLIEEALQDEDEETREEIEKRLPPAYKDLPCIPGGRPTRSSQRPEARAPPKDLAAPILRTAILAGLLQFYVAILAALQFLRVCLPEMSSLVRGRGGLRSEKGSPTR